jgi:hypothetical protein
MRRKAVNRSHVGVRGISVDGRAIPQGRDHVIPQLVGPE